jgi:hypothetical protein
LELALRLTLEETCPALPKGDSASSVDVLAVCWPELAKLLDDPSSVLRGDNDTDFAPCARANAIDDEWAKICKVLYSVGIVMAVALQDILIRHGRKVVNGAFGVVKAGKKVPTVQRGARRAVHLKLCNACQQMIAGSNSTLVGPSAWMRIELLNNDTVLMFWGDDLVCCFYVYRLPRAWWPLFVFEKKVPLAVLVGPEKGGVEMCYVGVTVIPMGWLSASGVVQSIQRGIFLNHLDGSACHVTPKFAATESSHSYLSRFNQWWTT